MNIAVKHNGSTITSYVVSYNREHHICNSIGTLELILSGDYSASISPHDTFDIYENGSFQVRYYVSDVARNVPGGTITIQAQDRSKYIVDYFIPTQYTIDYPSYTKYWIEKFLTEAQVPYQFTTSSQGNLISNDTSLGLQPAYDQIMMLLQLSGWYMYFDGNGKAIIGTLDTDLATSAGSIGTSDIINIERISDDKMLRNRAVVWGQYDPFSREYSYADVSKHTPWNYDRNDLRTMVISNNNIPNKSSAYGIANQLLKEFSRITIEKHITVWGARNWDLGKALRVNSHVWRGKGLITTFGVTMDRNGLTTNVVLDERCPRLFGFFNFGDYVYVGTFGDGIWRKHIKFDPTFYNFSTGLTDLNITDLYINNGIFGSVGHSGGAFYANNEDGAWNSITLSSLMSSSEDSVPSGQLVNYIPFSGLMTRATVIDKELNTVKFGIDTFSGLNTGDYFLTNPSGFIASSGVSISGYRGWIVEYDPYTGLPVGYLGSGIYPINYSGNYNFMVLDLENDGINDYVSVMSIGSGITYDSGYDFGHLSSFPIYKSFDSTAKVGFSDLDYSLEGQSLYKNIATVFNQVTAIFDNELNDERDVIWLSGTSPTGVLHKLHFYKEFDITLNRIILKSTQTDSPGLTGLGNFMNGIYETSAGVYNLYHTVESSPGGSVLGRLTRKVITWDSNANSLGSNTTLATLDIPKEPDHSAGGVDNYKYNHLSVNGIAYTYVVHQVSADAGAFFGSDIHNYIEIYNIVTNMNSTSTSSGLVTRYDFNDRGVGIGSPLWRIAGLKGTGTTIPDSPDAGPANAVWLFQNGNNPAIAFFLSEWNKGIASSATSLTNWFISSLDGSTFTLTQIQTTSTSSDADFLLQTDDTNNNIQQTQLDETHFLVAIRKSTGTSRPSYVCNGVNVAITDLTSGMPYYYTRTSIFPMYNSIRGEYLAKTGSDYYWIDCSTLSPSLQAAFPSGYTIVRPFSVSSSPLEQFFWLANRNSDSKQVILKLERAGTLESVIVPFETTFFIGDRGLVIGNFFFDLNNFILTPTGNLRILCVDNIYPALNTTNYLVLQREGADFNLIQQATKPIRIDISNNSPVLTVQDLENTFVSNYVYGNELQQIIPVSGLMTAQVRDYRYTLFEVASGVVVASGAGVESQILYVTGSGVYNSNIDTYSGGFVLWDEIPSGLAERIETTNFVSPGQFVFVTTSGDNPMFYQRDNDGFGFIPYSGLPDSRATIIRCDDRL